MRKRVLFREELFSGDLNMPCCSQDQGSFNYLQPAARSECNAVRSRFDLTICGMPTCQCRFCDSHGNRQMLLWRLRHRHIHLGCLQFLKNSPTLDFAVFLVHSVSDSFLKWSSGSSALFSDTVSSGKFLHWRIPQGILKLTNILTFENFPKNILMIVNFVRKTSALRTPVQRPHAGSRGHFSILFRLSDCFLRSTHVHMSWQGKGPSTMTKSQMTTWKNCATSWTKSRTSSGRHYFRTKYFWREVKPVAETLGVFTLQDTIVHFRFAGNLQRRCIKLVLKQRKYDCVL